VKHFGNRSGRYIEIIKHFNIFKLILILFLITTKMQEQKLYLFFVTFCVDPGGWKKSVYGVYNEMKETLQAIQDQVEDVDSLIFGQRSKLHIISKNIKDEIWVVENSYDLESDFQLFYKNTKIKFDENGLVDDHSNEYKELDEDLSNGLTSDDIDMKVCFDEENAVKFLNKYKPFPDFEKNTTIKISGIQFEDINKHQPKEPLEIDIDEKGHCELD
jgi:hypothetical protein